MTGLGESRRSLPWRDNEFIYVNGFRLVYVAPANPADPVVILPKGKQVAVSALVAAGHDVRLPQRIRWSSYA